MAALNYRAPCVGRFITLSDDTLPPLKNNLRLEIFGLLSLMLLNVLSPWDVNVYHNASTGSSFLKAESLKLCIETH